MNFRPYLTAVAALAAAGFTIAGTGCQSTKEADPVSAHAEKPARLPVPEPDTHTGTVVATRGNDIAVLIDGRLTGIRLEGFGQEGGAVAAAVEQSPAHRAFKASGRSGLAAGR